MNSPIKFLGLAASPRRNGNSTILLKEALRGAADAGAETELLLLNSYKFSGCLACDGCFKDGECVINDDMQVIYKKILEADRLALAAPIFSMGMCSQAKAMIDRTQRFWSTRFILKRDVVPDKERRPPRKGIFISVAGSGHKKVFDGAIQVAKYFFLMLETQFTGEYCYHEIDRKGDILNHPKILNDVYQAGFDLAGSPYCR